MTDEKKFNKKQQKFLDDFQKLSDWHHYESSLKIEKLIHNCSFTKKELEDLLNDSEAKKYFGNDEFLYNEINGIMPIFHCKRFKIRNIWEHTYFKDKKTKKNAVVCERKIECRPPKSIDDYKNNGGDLIHDYESVEWNLKEDENDMPYEGGEYKGEEIDDVGDWIGIICEKYNLINDETTVDRIKVEWEDGTFEEWDKDELFESTYPSPYEERDKK